MLRNFIAFVVFVAVIPAASAQDEKVVRNLAPDAVEALLKDQKIEFVKSSSKKGDEHYYDFKRDAYKIRLTCFSPSEFMLDCVFRGVPIEKVNVWNASTRFSRASYHKDMSGEFTILEYGLDLSGGVTTGAIKQFLVRFDEELKKYDRYLGNSASDDVVLAQVSDEKLENIFKTQGINYSKKANKDGFNMFDFELSGQSIRLYNFGGKDLMMDTHFKKISLEHVNIYNLSRKFVRVVNYKGKDVEYTSLEANLDCEAGVTEGMVRHWILSFGDDARHFADYSKKLQMAQK